MRSIFSSALSLLVSGRTEELNAPRRVDRVCELLPGIKSLSLSIAVSALALALAPALLCGARRTEVLVLAVFMRSPMFWERGPRQDYTISADRRKTGTLPMISKEC